MVRYRRGERAAFAELVRRYVASLHTFAWYLTRNSHLADQLVVDTFLEVVGRAAEFKHETRFATWAFSIALRQARQLTNQGAFAPGDHEEELGERSPTACASRALAGLPTLQLEALLLVELGGMRLDEIAELLELDPTTLRMQLGYAIEFVRQAFSGLEEYVRALR